MGKKSKKESETPCKETFEPLSLVSKAPATVVLLLNSQEEDILEKACEAIHTFAEKGVENKVSLLGLGTLEPLCRLIAHSNKLVRRNAFMALGIMATNGEVNKALKKLNAIPSIIQKLTPDEDVVVHEFATLCLASLSVDFTCRLQIYTNNGMPPIIKLLTSPDPDVTKNSLEIIFNLVQNDYKCHQAVHELGGIPSLLELLKSDFPVIQHLALKILQFVTTDKDAQKTFREEQGFEKLMDVLHNVDLTDLHAEALYTAANCLNDIETLQLIHNNGRLERLMEFVLTANNPETQSIAVKCLTRIAQDSENCNVLHEKDIEKALVELLSAEDDNTKASVCQAVAAMSFLPASKDRFRDLGVVPVVVQQLSSESSILREAAAKALSWLSHNNKANALAVYEAGGHKVLIQQLCGICTSTLANSAATLFNMAEQEIIRSSILSHGAMQALVEPLKSKDPQVLINSAMCVALLACGNEERAKVTTKHSTLQNHSYPEASGNSRGSGKDSQVMLGNLLRGHTKHVEESVLDTLEQIRTLPTNKMLSMGKESCPEFIQSYAGRKNSNKLGNLVHAATFTQATFQAAGGLQPLISLLRSNNKELLQSACFAVNVCAGDTACAVEMCKLGALEILQEINQSVNRRSSFSKLAMNSLLNSNLPVKYSLIGHLASTDLITNGFYDAGKARLGQRVLTLEELSKQPINQHRPIIVVNIPSEETVDLPEERQASQLESEVSNKRGRMTPMKKKEKDTQYDEVKEPPTEKQQNIIEDVSLQMLIKKAKDTVLPLKDEKEQYAALARLVSEAMGGAVAKEKLHQFQWVLHQSELKVQLKSNIIPIGLINKGIYCHRALLFKCLADCIEKSCTLVRGEYNRAWNEVLLFGEDSNNISSYIVDLMHQPGTLMAVNTPAALQYHTI